jgi:PAS domain S-box-containing protein
MFTSGGDLLKVANDASPGMNMTTHTLVPEETDLLEQARDALLVWDMDGQIQYMNRGAERLLGWSLEQARGCSAKELFFKGASDFEVAREQLLRNGQWFGEMRLATRSSEPVIVESRWALKAGDKGLPARVVAVNTDITERKRLEEAILSISEREQRRIGQDLHDGLCQRLFSVALTCDTLRQKLEDQALPEAVDAAKILTQISTSLMEARGLALGLSLSNLAKDGLTAALRDLADATRKESDVVCAAECADSVSMSSAVVATYLYRIAREAVCNAIKHARPSRITIRLTTEADTVCLSIADDGVGIANLDGPKRGMGLEIMRFRANMIGGELKIRQAASGGTVVSCSISRSRCEAPAQ